MKKAAGGNARDMKHANRLRVLQLLCTEGPLPRGQIALRTGLTKMTTSNITADLLEAGLAAELPAERAPGGGAGRTPVLLGLAPSSPCVLGVFIGRRHCGVLICDLAASVLAEETFYYDVGLDGEKLIDTIVKLFYKVRARCDRPLLGAGISAVGPLNASTGTLLSPPNFYGIRNLPVRELLAARLGLPCALIHDSSGGALAERLYGAGRGLDDFLYLHLQDGIGAGLVANGELFDGAVGLGGELGHTSINFDGPPCPCGNRGCLELYANDRALAAELLRLRGEDACGGAGPSFREIVELAGHGDGPAAAALDGFCNYVSYALVNCLNIVDTHQVFVGYRGDESGLLERLLESKVNSRLLAGECRRVRVERSRFLNRAPVFGAVALVARQVFRGELPVLAEG